jgi:O-antigen/teichoic acid export membrane protein
MEQNALLYTIQGVLQVFITKLAYLSMGFVTGRGEHAILLLTVLMAAFSLAFFFIQRKSFSPAALKETNRPFLKETVSFALPLVPLTLLDWLNNNVNIVVMNSLLGKEAVAIFSSALGLAATINIIQTGFNTYWAPYVLDNYDSQDGRFYTVHRMMACLLCLFGLAISLLQTPVFLFLGKSYRSSSIFFPFLFISPICYCLGETTDMGITISKKTYWTTIIFLVSSVLNILLCVLLIPRFGMAGAAMASAGTAVVILFLRTGVGQRYYRGLPSWRYLFITVGLMAAAAFGNLLLDGQPLVKYLLLAGLLLAAVVIYLPEIKVLVSTAADLAGAILSKVRKKA